MAGLWNLSVSSLQRLAAASPMQVMVLPTRAKSTKPLTWLANPTS